jgi:hypothetical protein
MSSWLANENTDCKKLRLVIIRPIYCYQCPKSIINSNAQNDKVPVTIFYFLLIDTHSKNETEPYWRSEWGNDIKFSSRSSNSRGVAILFRNTFQYHIEKEIKDSDGNFIILSIICLVSFLYLMKAPYNWYYQFLTMP